ncbi:MAG: hypothetical protein ACRD0P_20660, partial [Stackebrandtia sp.]
TSAELWRRLGTYVGEKRLGPTPRPDPEAKARGASEAAKLLARTRHVVAGVQRGEMPFDPPTNVVVAAVGIGAICGLIALCGAALLMGTGADDNARAISQAAALVALFCGALAGIPIVAGWLSVRHHVGVQVTHVIAAAAGSVATIAVLSPWLLLG